jgi:hypothetical protein
MEFEESIFNLIPKEAYVPPKDPRYKSKHSYTVAPTASTFGLKTTSKPGVSNMSGAVEPPSGSHSMKAPSATFGLSKGGAKPNPNTFRLKGTGTMVLDERKYLFYTQFAPSVDFSKIGFGN